MQLCLPASVLPYVCSSEIFCDCLPCFCDLIASVSACPLADLCLINIAPWFGSPGDCLDKSGAGRKEVGGSSGFFSFSDCGAWASRPPALGSGSGAPCTPDCGLGWQTAGLVSRYSGVVEGGRALHLGFRYIGGIP